MYVWSHCTIARSSHGGTESDCGAVSAFCCWRGLEKFIVSAIHRRASVWPNKNCSGLPHLPLFGRGGRVLCGAKHSSAHTCTLWNKWSLLLACLRLQDSLLHRVRRQSTDGYEGDEEHKPLFHNGSFLRGSTRHVHFSDPEKHQKERSSELPYKDYDVCQATVTWYYCVPYTTLYKYTYYIASYYFMRSIYRVWTMTSATMFHTKKVLGSTPAG